MQSPCRQCIQAQWSHLIGLPVPEEVDRAIQSPLDNSPAPRVVSLVTPHLHKAVGILRFHQVDGAGAVTILQGLQAISPWTCRHNMCMLQLSATRLHHSYTIDRHTLQQRAKEHILKGQIFIFNLEKSSTIKARAQTKNQEAWTPSSTSALPPSHVHVSSWERFFTTPRPCFLCL